MDEFDLDGDELLGSVCFEEDDNKQSSEIPADFPFPFEPYDIQKNFMTSLYSCLEQGQIGIFESPTGTGKSLSLICGALRWLKDYQEKQRRELEKLLADEEKKKTEKSPGKNEPDWVMEFTKNKEKQDKLDEVKKKYRNLQKQELKIKEIKSGKNQTRKRKRNKLEEDFDELLKGASPDIQDAFREEINQIESIEGIEIEGDADLVPEDYHSDQELKGDNSESEDSEEETEHTTKIYYCSRTHSQLSQFVREVNKSPYGNDTRVISLGSRQNLCVNEAVKKLKSLSLMNDACLDLQKNKTKKIEREDSGEACKKRKNNGGATCPFYKQDQLDDLSIKMLADVMDIEQTVKAGRELKACPYYGSRFSIPLADIVVLPYNTLLHKSTREASGIRLQGNIVLIDEAHNLLETINSVYSVEVTGSQLLKAHNQLSQYENRFRSRLKAKNLLYVKQILFILSCLVKYLGGKTDISGDNVKLNQQETKLITVGNFLLESQFDNINLFKVLQYCSKSQISKKLNGFVEKYPNMQVENVKEKKTAAKNGVLNFLKEIAHNNENEKNQTLDPVNQKVVNNDQADGVILRSPLVHIESFLAALTNEYKDGRIVVNRQSLLSQCSLKFLHLNPAVHFTEVLTEARSVIVAGGTMQPINVFKEQLFYAAGVKSERIHEYSCGHVIPPGHLLAISLSSGPLGVELDFTYQTRDSPKLLNELGLVLSNVCQVVPGGIVCFFPSYDYQKLVYSNWEKNGVLEKLGKKKRVFQEPKIASHVDNVLNQYSKCILEPHGNTGLSGAILFCVVGGKMSEGINFSDDLGRCVVMVGMPYPNIQSPELKEKMQYLNLNFPKDNEGRLPGQVHYQNLCMKAVNQSIGRAIRHRQDYATILLLDKRYGKQNITSKLPTWIAQHLVRMDKYGPAVAAMSKFYREKIAK